MFDYFTKAAEAEPMKSQDPETVASVFFNGWICQHGVPESVHSGQGPNFESRLCIEPCKMCRISKTRTTPAHPQGNGQVERTNRTLIGLLKAFTRDAQPDDWDLSLGCVLLAYRAMVHTSTGVSPFKMPKGCEMRVPSDIFVPNTDGSADNVPEDPFRVVKALSPTNYLVRNVQLRTRPVIVHHNKMRPYKGPPPVGYEDEVYVLTEDRRLPQGERLPGRRLSTNLQTGSPTWKTLQIPSPMEQGPISGGEGTLAYKIPRPQRTTAYPARNRSSH
ncbi:KRAB-A domain-containing protein [Echinococcus multilocularis]|uniref:KRAB-A domain-containing protein n=1 Tax=Echinococcus multilocularis TaxID=6211 RepID=A0A068Y7J4_ECHMU|nr:KRAB-A domain-containing protein [Echinococcus multilocularis]